MRCIPQEFVDVLYSFVSEVDVELRMMYIVNFMKFIMYTD